VLKTNNLGRKTAHNMPSTVEDEVMGELDISGSGSILVLAGDRPHVHAYLNIIYFHICQYYKSYSHAYVVLAYRNNLC
jgi:hypothetical protein